jgi:hypothetical protein
MTRCPSMFRNRATTPTSSGKRTRSRAAGIVTSTNSENTIRDKGAHMAFHFFRIQSRQTDGKPDHRHRSAEIRQFYPPVIAKNKGKWLYHEVLQPGVLVHVAESGDEVYTVRCGGARLMRSPTSAKSAKSPTSTATAICVSPPVTTSSSWWTTNPRCSPCSTIWKAASSTAASFKFPVGGTGCRYHQHRSHPGLDSLPHPGYRCFRSGQGRHGRLFRRLPGTPHAGPGAKFLWPAA